MAKARILLVEDEAFIRDLMSEILQEAELDVIEASNGDEAIAMLGRERFDLVMTDVHMTGRTDGIGVARSVRARQPGIPVIFATGRPEALNAFGALGPREVCLVKPFTPQQALKMVHRLLAE